MPNNILFSLYKLDSFYENIFITTKVKAMLCGYIFLFLYDFSYKPASNYIEMWMSSPRNWMALNQRGKVHEDDDDADDVRWTY